MTLFDFLNFLYKNTTNGNISWDIIEERKNNHIIYTISFVVEYELTSFEVRFMSNNKNIFIEENGGRNIRSIELAQKELSSIKDNIVNYVIENNLNSDEKIFEKICKGFDF